MKNINQEKKRRGERGKREEKIAQGHGKVCATGKSADLSLLSLLQGEQEKQVEHNYTRRRIHVHVRKGTTSALSRSSPSLCFTPDLRSLQGQGQRTHRMREGEFIVMEKSRPPG